MQLPPAFVEPTPRRIRVRLGDALVADSTRAQLLVQYGPGGLPTYYLPQEDVRPGALSDETTSPAGSDDGRSPRAMSELKVPRGRTRTRQAAWPLSPT